MSYETDAWKYVEAKWYTKVEGKRKVRLVVIHNMEYFEKPDTAEIIAHDFATRPPSIKASAHICVDNNSIIQCVKDNDVAYAAPGANSDGIQIELAGYAKQAKSEWLDFYGIALLALGSDAAAQYCLKFGIPPVHLTDAQVKDGTTKGVCGHDQVSRVFKKSSHSDPGPSFPWLYFMGSVLNFYSARHWR